MTMIPTCRLTPRHAVQQWLSRLLLLCLCSLPLHVSAQETPEAAPAQPTFDELVRQLPTGNLRQRATTVEQLASQQDERLADIFTALIAGDLLANKDKPPVVAIRNGDTLTDALNGTDLTAPADCAASRSTTACAPNYAAWLPSSTSATRQRQALRRRAALYP
ncbi:hypothetical protein ULG90_12120 [Halopseudomonas pachastrellae]|nr:hypothetical protein ULG90_12120 [Halopseudomonas pachastrellae]